MFFIPIQKQQEAIPLQTVINKRPSYTGMEGTCLYIIIRYALLVFFLSILSIAKESHIPAYIG